MNKLVVTKRRLTDCEERLDEGAKDFKKGFLVMGEALAEILDNDLWRFADSQSFDDYVCNNRGMKKSWAYGLVDVHKEFGELLIRYNVDVTRCVRLLPHITETNKEELLQMASNTRAVDFEANLRNLGGKVAPDECVNHEWVEIKRCKVCGLKVKND